MIYALIAFWPLLASVVALVLCIWALRRTSQRRGVQVWVGESYGGGAEETRDGCSNSPTPTPGRYQDGGASSNPTAGPRISGSLELPQSAQMRSRPDQAAPVSSVPPVDFVVPMDDDLREALKASLRGPTEPRHFRVLRWLGIECRITQEIREE